MYHQTIIMPFSKNILLKGFFIMEKEIMIGMAEHQIGGYVFKNKDLLIQAFTRRSFTEENGGE